jgi:PAS domain S-box-containing protein
LIVIVLLVYYFLLKTYHQSDSKLVRRQIIVISLGMAIPAIASVLFVTGLTSVDFTPVAFTALFVLSTVAITRYRVLDVVPIARDSIVRNMDAGVLVLNDEGRIVDINRRGQAIINREAETILGRPVSKVFADYDPAIEAIETLTDDSRTVSIDGEGGSRQYQVTVSPVQDENGRIRGRVIIFNDVTEQVARQRQLEQQNEELERKNQRLDQFASIVSHDLRNPLNVASGRVDIARETFDSDDLDIASEALDRMEAIIEDVLTLTRQGQAVSSMEWRRLSDLAESAWQNYDTVDGTLDIESDIRLRCDPSRLKRLLENTFRNAVEHAGADSTVRVGALETGSGFYVADDGPGFPEEDRDRLVEYEYSTAEQSSGLGLAIVKEIAQAHGWHLRLTDSSEGGARIEVSDVDTESLRGSS